MGQYSISDVEAFSGVKAHTLRMWEQRYDFLKPQRTQTNIRYYTDEQLKLILNIGALSRSGMKISKIAGMPNDELCREVERIALSKGCGDAMMDALICSMLDFDEARFEKTLSCAIMKRGFVNTFNELLFPVMSRTGVLWTTGALHPAQEHFMSNLIRRKLLAAIDNQYIRVSPEGRKFVLFLPEGETHELVLLLSEYIIRQHNHLVLYLGSSVPIEDVEFMSETFKPDYLLTFFTLPLQEMEMQEYIDRLAKSIGGGKLICGGKQLELKEIELPGNSVIVRNSEELLNTIPCS